MTFNKSHIISHHIPGSPRIYIQTTRAYYCRSPTELWISESWLGIMSLKGLEKRRRRVEGRWRDEGER